MKDIKWKNLYTSIEQSKQLLALGLDRSTADCIYTKYKDRPANGDERLNSVCQDEEGNWWSLDFYDQYFDEDEDFSDAIPCWSIGALLRLTPPIDNEWDFIKILKDILREILINKN